MSDDVLISGITVLEIGERVCAGACGSLLAQIGCRVVFAEPADEPRRDDLKWRARAQFVGGKHSIRIARGDDALLRRLVDASDVVLTCSDVDRLTVDVDCSTRVHCDLTAFGHSGPLSGQACSDLQIQAMSGMLDTTGMQDGVPVPVGGAAAEFLTGLHACGAVLAALRVLRRDGIGQLVDMALFDCAYATLATFLPKWVEDPRAPVGRMGNRHSMASPWNVYPAHDGWVLMCTASDAQWLRLCEVIERPDLATDVRFARAQGRAEAHEVIDADIALWTRARSVADCIAAFSAVNIACGPIAPLDGYPREANLEHRRMVHSAIDDTSGRTVHVPASPIRADTAPGRAPERLPAPDADRGAILRLLDGNAPRPARVAQRHARAPLAGVRVIEIGHYTTAPLGARHLANLGADVIKIEPPGGEAMRAWAPARDGQGLFFTLTNCDKRSLVLDLRSEPGAHALGRLLERADVLIENLKPGALARLGFDRERLARINPRLIYCAISGFGEDSVYAGRPAFDTVIQAMCGTMAITKADGVPVKAGISIADLMGAALGVVEIIAGLERRDRLGRGQAFDLAMQDVGAWATQLAWNDAAAGRVSFVACADGLVVASGELPPHTGAAHAASTRAHCAEWLRAQGMDAAPVLRVGEVACHPQALARGLMFDAVDGQGRKWPLLASPFRLTRTPPQVSRPAGPLGADTAAILAGPDPGSADTSQPR